MGAAIIAQIEVFSVFVLSCFTLPFNKYVAFFSLKYQWLQLLVKVHFMIIADSWVKKY